MAGGASSYRNNESPFRKASEFSGVPNSIYNSIRSPGGYGGADFSGNLPPLGYSHQQETLRTNSPKLFGGPLLTPIESRRDEVEDAEANQTDGDENWFFDSGIFETDWLRWGGLGTEPTPTTEQEHPPPGPSHPERHMSTCSTTSVNGNVPSLASSRTSGANSKDLSSPASTSSEYNAYPPNSRDIRLPSVSPIKDSSDRDDFLPWGWQASREEPRKRITLPPLRQVLGECSTQRHEHQNSSTTFSPRFSNAEPKIIHNRIGSVNDHIRTELISLLKLPYSRHPYYDDFDIESKFPSKELIDSFVALYFKHFHYNIPMIHRPTFKVENCPSILLVAMASIGASYSDVEGAKNFADGLSELCKRALAWMAEYDNGYLRSDYYLTAYCLQHLYALGSGHQALYDAADSSRSFLVSNARRCGLFNDTTSCYTPPNSTPPTSPRALITHEEYTRSSVNVNDDERHLNAQWASWCEQEKRKRVAWAIISYDCSFSTLSNRRGSICMNDIKARLPCDEAMWEAPTAHAWAALLPPPNFLNSKTVYRGMPFSATLRDVISGKQSPKEIPSWGKELCAWALGRLLWDFREMEQTALGCGLRGAASGLGLPALTDGLRETKEAVLSALGTLGDAAWENEQEELDSLHLNLTTLIAHYSHLHFGVPTISLILSLARCPPHHQQPPLNDTIEDPRVTRLRSIFSENPVHARTIAWHAGQIIGISRHRPAHTPAETMRVFLAGVVLWGVAKWFVECRSMAAANMWTCGLNDGGDIPLDAVPMKPYGMPGRVAEWLKMGKGRATIRRDGPVKEGDIQLCSEQGAKEVLQVVVSIIGRLRIWGLGGEFRRVLEGMGK
ncbi:fungal-specific transcription factor domain-containing protein [Peziza echinospora]|nr:fungal-specific transcription factor domain-containing protein [Peziza echinospora]